MLPKFSRALPKFSRALPFRSELSAMKKLPIETLPFDDIYILDANLVICYAQKSNPNFNTWADQYILRGGTFLLLPQTIFELRHLTIPFGFAAIEQEDCKEQQILDGLVDSIAKSLNLTESAIKNMRNDIELIAEAGYCSAGAIESQVPAEAIRKASVVFASGNFQALKSILGTKEKQEEVERLIDLFGFEHLIPVRFISKDGWYDMCS